jgi:hypothetical protein
MTLASDISTTSTALSDIKQAIIDKGVTPSGNITTYATAIAQISGGGGSGTTDVELTRFKDDNNNEIGTWYMNFEDDNGNVYKVILLDAQYRKASTQWCSGTTAVTNMPLYSGLKTANVWEAKETATQNTRFILNYCSAGGYTSTSCSHCRSQSFTIDGTTYYGQLPNCLEVVYLAKHYNEFDSLDTSASSHSSTNFSSDRGIWSSNQSTRFNGWNMYSSGSMGTNSKTASYFACPVLEIPL